MQTVLSSLCGSHQRGAVRLRFRGIQEGRQPAKDLKQMIMKLVGAALIFYAVNCFIQSFRHEDSKFALMQDGIDQDPQSTSAFLRIVALISFGVGLFLLLR